VGLTALTTDWWTADAWTGRYALDLLMIALGLPLLIGLVSSPLRRVALVGVAVVAFGALSAALSGNFLLSLFGEWIQSTSLVLLTATVAAWAIGVHVDDRGRRWLEIALISTAGLNALVALAGTLAPSMPLELERVANRHPGLLGNPVFLAPFLAGALWLVLDRFLDRPQWWGGVVAVLAAALQASGSRAALGMLVVLLAAAVRRVGWRAAALFACFVIAGAVIGEGSARIGHAVTTSERLTASSAAEGGIRPRLEEWSASVHAIAERPLVGYGPGRYAVATSHRQTLRRAQAEAPDSLFYDAHDLFVEDAVTLGLPGLGLVLAFLYLAGRRALWKAPLAGFGGILLLGHLFQPQHVALTPLALLTLGAATPSASALAGAGSNAWRWARVAGAAVGVVLFLSMCVGSILWRHALLEHDDGMMDVAIHLVPPWPDLDLSKGVLAGRFGDAASIPWAERAVASDTTRPDLWKKLADLYLSTHDLPRARAAYGRALALSPWSVDASIGLARVEQEAGKREAAIAHLRRVLRVDPANADAKGGLEVLEQPAP